MWKKSNDINQNIDFFIFYTIFETLLLQQKVLLDKKTKSKDNCVNKKKYFQCGIVIQHQRNQKWNQIFGHEIIMEEKLSQMVDDKYSPFDVNYWEMFEIS